jgi:hypothetical protein
MIYYGVQKCNLFLYGKVLIQNAHHTEVSTHQFPKGQHASVTKHQSNKAHTETVKLIFVSQPTTLNMN